MADHDKKEIDEITGTETTQHEWDGIKELNTPLPKWWLYTFYGTIAWGLVYTVLYPAWPMVTEATAGILGHTNRGAFNAAMAEHEASQARYVDRIAELEIGEVASDADLAQFARAGGAAVFRAHCSQCHGAGAAGVAAAGYPNLRDDAWLWGGSLEEIYLTVKHGIRNEDDPDARYSEMPAFGELEILSTEEIETVADHVLSFTGGGQASEAGAELYEINCAACHGENGEGMHMMGAPALNDAVWLYGGDRETVIETIHYSRYGVMPAWGLKLDDADIKQAAIYVHALGGGTASE